MSQIPEGAEGTVAGVMVYCCICIIASIAMIWLSWTHDERTSYVAMISYFATISIVASLIQQGHDVARYRTVVADQFEHRKSHPNNPEVAIANGSTGLNLVLYYIQYYCYSVEAMCVMFWTAFLAQSVYGLSARSRLKTSLRRINRGGKVFSMLFPLVTILLLRIPQVQRHFVAFMLLADLPLMLSLLCGCVLMLMIVGRYVHSRRQFLHWSDHAASESNGATISLDHSSAGGGKSTPTASQARAGLKQSRGMWDRWLLVRFTIAFVALSAFEVTNTLFQINAVMNANEDSAASAPDFSADRARRTWIFYMPGVTPGLFIFIVFGTTRTLRTYMYRSLVPKRWQKGDQEGQHGATPLAGSRRGHAGPPVPPKDGAVTLVELQTYQNSGSSREQGATATHGRKANQVIGEESSGCDSDEFPILPIYSNRP